MKKKITIFNFIISAILVFTVTACGQKSEENKNTSVSTNGSDMLFSTDAYEKKLCLIEVQSRSVPTHMSRTLMKFWHRTKESLIFQIVILQISGCNFFKSHA